MRKVSFAKVCSLVISVGVFQCAYGQLWSGIIGPGRAIDWTQVGIPGGIPTTRKQCGSTLTPSGGDDTSAIQSALNGCASAHPVTSNSPGDGGYVLLSGTPSTPATFSVTNLTVGTNVSLRGGGANATILSENGTGGSVISMTGSEPHLNGAVSISSGASSGSTSIVVASGLTFAVGDLMVVTQPNTGIVSNVGSGGTCTWCDGWTDPSGGPYYNQGQIVLITSVNGSTLGFTPGLFQAYSGVPIAIPFRPLTYAGVEDLQVYANNKGYSTNFFMDGCMECWVEGVEGNYVDGNGDHVQTYFGYRDQVTDNYFTSMYNYTGGSTEGELLLAYKTSNTLVQNNIFERLQSAVDVGYGSEGNVVAYNLMEGADLVAAGSMAGTGTTYTHGANPEFTLWEGNFVPSLYTDSVWGTEQYQTFFRNWGFGTDLACYPASGRTTVNCTGANSLWQTDGDFGAMIDGLSTSANLIGNVLGSAQQSALTSSAVQQFLWPTSRPWPGYAGWVFGYTSIADGGTNSIDNTNAYTTATLNGNCFNMTAPAQCVWQSGSIPLPGSFYLSAQPSWWRSSVKWPAIGPDVTGGNGPGGWVSTKEVNPATSCFYDVMGGSYGGAGGPYTFNAAACYGSSTVGSNGTPAAPTGLNAVFP